MSQKLSLLTLGNKYSIAKLGQIVNPWIFIFIFIFFQFLTCLISLSILV
jgi:hypothetical protein